MSTLIGESSPDVIASFMQQVILEYVNYGRDHRRSEPREAVAIPVQVQPLDNQLQPTGEGFSAITRDISYAGIGLFHRFPIDQGLLQISMSAPETHEEMRLLARIEHCTRCGQFFIIGCNFTGLNTPDAAATETS